MTFVCRILPSLVVIPLGMTVLALGQILFLQTGQTEFLRISHTTKLVIPVVLMLISLKPFLFQPLFKDLALGYGLAALTITAWGLFDEVARLYPYASAITSAKQGFAFLDPYLLAAMPISLGAAAFFFTLAARGSRRLPSGRFKPERSKRATFGDAEWMSIKEAERLFPEGPGIVIGEALLSDNQVDRYRLPNMPPMAIRHGGP